MRIAIIAIVLSACGAGNGALPRDAAIDARCGDQQLALIVTPGRLHVSVDLAAVLLVDTGSSTTFLSEPLGSPDPVHDAGTIALGCRTLDVDGRPVVADPPLDGVPSIGTLGTDVLLGGPSKLDIAGAQLAFHGHGEPFDEAASWPAAPFERPAGLVVPQVALDGMPMQLMLDTGSPDTLWLGQSPQPGDVEVDTTDAEGHVVKLYQGTADLAIGAWHGRVPVLRAPSFPYLEATIASLGGNIAGLLGLSSLGGGVVIDVDANVVRVDS
jgi:hypothetical protein